MRGALIIKDTVAQQLSIELALRRVIHYISNKLASKENSSVRLCDMFGTYDAFFQYVSNSQERAEFLRKCQAAEAEAATFCKTAMEGGILIHSQLEKSIETNWLLPAEVIMQREEWRKSSLIDLDELMRDADPVEPAVLELKAAKEKEALDPASPSKPESQPIEDEVPEETEPESSAALPLPEVSRRSHFKVASPPDWAEDLFKKVTLTTFEQSLAHAQTCASLSCCQSCCPRCRRDLFCHGVQLRLLSLKPRRLLSLSVLPHHGV